VDIEHESNVELLRQKALCLLQENQRLSKKVVDLLRENLSLKGMSPDQLQNVLALLDDELNKAGADTPGPSPSTERRAPPTEPKERKPQTGHGPKAQPNLPIVPERLVPGGRYSNDFAVEVATGKYADHLPLERQTRIMAREGLDVDSQTLWDQVLALAKTLDPAWQRLRAEAIQSAVLGFDETRWEVLTKGSASKKSWVMWQLSTRTIVYFAIASDHDSEAGKKFLNGFSGIAIGDAATVHKSMVKGAPYRLAFCWAHARRKFLAAEKSDPVRVKQFLDWVKDLYTVEELAPPGPDSDAVRKQLRDEKSRPVVEQIKAWLLDQRVLPGSDIAAAMQYVAKQWDGLRVFLEDPRVPLDNNRTERGFRGPALGRNNFYGSHSRLGTEVAAILYSLVESAKLVSLSPKAYLKTALAAALDSKPIPLPHELI